jgi:hypothetical protein
VGWNDHRDPDEDELPDLLNYLIDNGELAGAQLGVAKQVIACGTSRTGVRPPRGEDGRGREGAGGRCRHAQAYRAAHPTIFGLAEGYPSLRRKKHNAAGRIAPDVRYVVGTYV